VLTPLLVILLIAPYVVQDIAASVSSRQLTRLNYGVVFSPIRKVKLVSDIWSHIFDLHLPDLSPGNLHLQLPHCDNATSNVQQERTKRICEHNRALILTLHQQHVEMVEEILQTLQHIYHLLPADKNISKPMVNKRSLLPIGGYILSGLFGTTSEADLQPIKQHMKHIGQGMSALDRGLQVQQNRLESFIEMSTERLDSFRNLSTMQQHAISGLYDELRLVYNTETEDQERIIVTIKRMQRYITHLRHIDQLRQGIQLLLHGFLTPELVPKSALRSNLLSIQSHLERYFPNFDLVFDRASHFYALHDFLFARHGKRLLIQVQIPITTFQHEFTVYKVTSFHVPVTGRISHSTSLSDLPSFFVTSRHNHYYFFMDHDDDTRHPNLLYLLDNDIVFRSFQTGATCTSAIFRNNISQIRQLCSFSIHERTLEPSIHFLSNSRILLTNISQVTLDCGGEIRIVDGCVQCVREISCNCRVGIFWENSTQLTRFWSPKLARCRSSVNITKVRYVVNMASLQSFFSDTSLGALTGSSYLDQPLPVELPVFRHYKHKFHQFISKDVKRSHDLRKFSNRVKNDSIVFHEVSDIVLNHMSQIIGSYDEDTLLTPRVSEVSWWLFWSSIFCSYISFFLILYLCFKFRIFGSAFAFLRSGTTAAPTHFPSYLSYDTGFNARTYISNSSHHTLDSSSDGTTIVDLTTVLLLATLIILFLLLWVYLKYVRNSGLFLVLEIGNATTSVHIRCLSLHSAIYAYQFYAESYIQTLAVKYCCPALLVNWPTFKISHIIDNVSFKFPATVIITPWDALKIKRILNDKAFYCLCLLEFNTNFRLVDFESTDPPSSHAVLLAENDTSDDQNPTREVVATVSPPLRLYPSFVQLPTTDQ